MYERTLRILSCGGSGPGRSLYRRATLSAVKRVLLAAAMSSCSVLDHLLRYVQITRARSRRAVAIAPLLSVGFDEAMRRRRAASTKLIEQRTESMLVFLLPDFGSRVAGRMRHSWLRSACGPRRARAARRLRRVVRVACVVRRVAACIVRRVASRLSSDENTR